MMSAGQRPPVHPSSPGCKECIELGATWVHLRLCLSCGHVGCCDSSPLRHATGHFHRTQHPVIKSFEPAEDWAYCYVDRGMVEHLESYPVESASLHYYPPGQPDRLRP
jgi:uncharacterized UBP type Zn finger protein